MLASDLLRRAAWTLSDAENERWSQEMLLAFLSDAQRQVALRRPDATARRALVDLTPGSVQEIPADGLRLMDVVRAVGADGVSGRAVRLVDRSALDACEPGWHAAVASDGEASAEEPLPDQYVHDERTPRLFYVFPPVPTEMGAGGHLEIVYSADPAELTGPESPLAVDAVYAGPLLDYALHRAFALDTESETSRARSEAHLRAFVQAMEAKLPADLLVTPNLRSRQI
ncbi:MAG: DUF6682 family protein [Desulfocurvibacter africanus]